MEPPIQYAQPKEGVSIACWTLGEAGRWVSECHQQAASGETELRGFENPANLRELRWRAAES